MKTIITLAALIGSVSAAPAIVWTGESSSPTVHSSDVIELNSVVRQALNNSPEQSSLASAIFVLGRDADGNDGLTSHGASNSLPTVASLYSSASSIQHYVRGLDSVQSITKHAKSAAGTARSVVETTLDEFRSLTAVDHDDAEAIVSSDGAIAHHRKLKAADVLIVRIGSKADAGKIDSIVSAAVGNGKIGSVLLTTVRSVDESRLERNLQSRARTARGPVQKRRRLEDAADDAAAQADDDGDQSNEGIYFVNFTPNMFAGLLFFFFFVFIAQVGIGCLNQITCGDVYVKTYPHIGREV